MNIARSESNEFPVELSSTRTAAASAKEINEITSTIHSTVIRTIPLASGPPSRSLRYTAFGGLFTSGRFPHAIPLASGPPSRAIPLTRRSRAFILLVHQRNFILLVQQRNCQDITGEINSNG